MLPEATPEPEVVDQASEILRPLLRDPDQARQTARQLIAVSEELHVGPLPHPSTFQGYNTVLPGSAQEILNMAKLEQKHRHKMESLESRYPYCGLIAGALTLLACVGGAIYLGLHDKPGIALALLSAPLITAVGWFVNSRLKQSAIQKTAAIPPTPAVKPE